MSKLFFSPFIFHTNKKVFLLSVCFFLSFQVKAQSGKTSNQNSDPLLKPKVMIHKGMKLMNLNHYDEFNIIYNKTSRGQDSVSIQIYASEITYKKDTLIVKPEDLNVYRLMDTINAYSETRDFAKTTTLSIKIPVKEIESIKAKKQPLSKISGGIAAVSYVALMCSPFIAMSKNSSVSNFGVGLFLVSAPTLAISWSINGIWAKKRYHFDHDRTHKEIWRFE